MFISRANFLLNGHNSGGRLIQYLSRRRHESSSKSRKRERYLYRNSVFFGIKNSSASSDSNHYSSDMNTEQDLNVTQFTLGPEPEINLDTDGGLEKWSHLISKNPAPIKVEFLPLDDFFWKNNPKLKRDYNIALKFYQDLKWRQNNGFGENFVIKGKIGLSTLIKTSKQILENGKSYVGASCPDGMGILIGFILGLNADNKVIISIACIVGEASCFLKEYQEVEKSFAWILCHSEWKYELKQVIISNKDGDEEMSAKCPKNMRIIFGFAATFGGNDREQNIITCPAGRKTCHLPSQFNTGVIYAVCIHDNMISREPIIAHVGKSDKILIMKCPIEYPQIAQGIAFQQDTNNKIEDVLTGLTNWMMINKLICRDCDAISSWVICSS